MILGDKPLISEAVLSQYCSPVRKCTKDCGKISSKEKRHPDNTGNRLKGNLAFCYMVI
jgi:hypothetical protein